ncbi:SPOR domain-containing protein [Litoribrevibacter albus]|uniref:SPOR domain-containing protein n=1 Tax=Litoribrevibacter albus TaxID=1473156 RepID=A0AA37WA90_9GAMM|nr:AAA family ATPase [Litoribrevibacter albus]GLQ33461.1 hypothetical protein GCM10007876_39410 [Litoribrevibacter albus]
MSTVAQPEMTGFESEQVRSPLVSNRFFPGGQRGELLDQIVHLARFGSMTVNVTGEAGVGKSHLLHAVKASLPGNAIEVQASLLMSSSELLNQMLHQLMANRFHHDLPDLPSTSDEGALLSLIGSYLLRLADSGNSIVFLIDDAHEISEDALEVLLALVHDKKYRETVQCILFSELYIEKHLLKPSVKAAGGEQVFTLRVPVMDRASIAEYLNFIESVKPESERIMYSESDINVIHELSEGKLGQVNAAIRSLLEREMPSAVNSASFSLPKYQYAVLVVVALILGGIAFFYQAEKSQNPEGEVVRKEQLEPVITGQKVEEVEELSSLSVAEEEKPVSSRPASSSLLEQLRKKQEELLEERKNISAVGTKQAEQELQGNELNVSIAEVSAEKDVERPRPIDAPKPAVVTQQTQDKSVKSVGQDDAGKHLSIQWIAAQPGNRYTIQILGAHSKQNVTRYVDGFKGDKSQLHLYEGVLRGQPWFVLIYGSFENRESAKKTGTELGLKDLWIRNFSAIQKEMIR